MLKPSPKNILILMAFLLLIILSSTVRILTYDRYLPFIDYTDESVRIGYALHWRGISDESALIETYGELAPASVAHNYLVMEIYDAIVGNPYNLPSVYYPVLRLISVILGVLTTLLVASIAWQSSDWRGGLFAGMLWGLAPIIVEINNLALPDPPVYFFTALALAASIAAWKRQNPLYLLIALVAAVLDIYFKYWIVAPLLPSLWVLIIFFMQQRRVMLPWIIAYIFIAASTGAYFIFGVNPLVNHNKTSSFSLPELLSRAFDFSRLSNNFTHSLQPIGLSLFWIVIILAIVAWFFSQRRAWPQVDKHFVFLILLYLLVGYPLVSAISNVTPDGRMRHILPIALAIYALWGIAIAQICMTLEAWAKNRQLPLGQYLPVAFMVLIIGIKLPDYYTGNQKLIELFAQEHVVNVLRDWTDDNVPVDGYVLFPATGRNEIDRVWNRLWGAYDGDKPFVWWTETIPEILASSPQAYAERGIMFFMLNEVSLRGLDENSIVALQAFRDELLLLKTIDVDAENLAGSTVYFYRMLPPENTVNMLLGNQINLMGYDLDTNSLAAGETLVFRPYWTLENLPTANYSMFIHLHTAEDLQALAQYDGPLSSLERPTILWQDLNEVYIGQDIAFTIPSELETGEYLMTIGVYDFQTGQRLLNTDGESLSLSISVE